MFDCHFKNYLPKKLQIHPHGWCALSRNISYDESTEFTCLHDIQHRDYDESVELEIDMDVAKQKKILEETAALADNVPVVNTGPSTVQTSNSDSQALNLTTSTSTSTNVRVKRSHTLLCKLYSAHSPSLAFECINQFNN